MDKFIIKGGRGLQGKIAVSGSKNAALPLLFSCILLNGISTIHNVPMIGDVFVALKILEEFGANITVSGTSVTVDSRNLVDVDPSQELVSKIRASSYLLGARLARFSHARLQRFGGCNFENRPIDMHLSAAVALGATVHGDSISAKRLIGADIYFDKISVLKTIFPIHREGIDRKGFFIRIIA